MDLKCSLINYNWISINNLIMFCVELYYYIINPSSITDSKLIIHSLIICDYKCVS